MSEQASQYGKPYVACAEFGTNLLLLLVGQELNDLIETDEREELLARQHGQWVALVAPQRVLPWPTHNPGQHPNPCAPLPLSTRRATEHTP